MQPDIQELGKALEPYGYSDIVCTYPAVYLDRETASRLVRLDIRVKITDDSDDPRWMRRKLLRKYEEIWELLTGRFGLMLENFPRFEIRGELRYHVGDGNKPTPAHVYAEASYDCWVP